MNNFEDQLDVIRAELYEETKNMTNADAARFVNETARPIAAKHGIKIINNPAAERSGYVVLVRY
jgi:hypothetical protein